MPKEKNQNSTKTKEDIKQNINPTLLSVKVNKIHELKNNGAVSISCVNKQSVEKIEAEIKQKLGSDYEVQVPNMRNPKILVVGMHDKLDESTVCEAIKEQNNIEFKIIKCIQVYKSFKNNSIFNAIVEVDGEAFSKIISDGFLNVEWDRCKVYESFKIMRCYKCLGFNHKAINCSIGDCCFKCGDRNHLSKNCPEAEYKCLNCNRSKVILCLSSLDVNHDTRSSECPIYIRKMKIERNKVLY